MNDRLKFRALIKYKPTGETIYGDVEFLQMCNGEVERVTVDGQKYKNDLSEVKLIMSTGLRDKKGTLIFEGDVIKLTPCVVYGDSESSPLTFVEFDDEFGVYCLLMSNNEPVDRLYSKGSEEVEVIGNIYQNPELLKQT